MRVRRAHYFLSALILATVCCFALTLFALISSKVVRAGVATISFGNPDQRLRRRYGSHSSSFRDRDLPNLNLPDLSVPHMDLPDVNLPDLSFPKPEVIQSKIESAIGSLHTAASDIVEQAGDATGDIIGAVEDMAGIALPRNITMGTSKFCVGFTDNVNCDSLPINITAVLPAETIETVQSFVPGFRTLSEQLPKFTIPVFLWALISAQTFTSCLLLLCTIFAWHLFRQNVHFWGWHKVYGYLALLLSLFLFLVYVIILGVLTKVESASSLISVLPLSPELRFGPLRGLSIGGTVMAVFMLSVSSAMLRWA